MHVIFDLSLSVKCQRRLYDNINNVEYMYVIMVLLSLCTRVHIIKLYQFIMEYI